VHEPSEQFAWLDPALGLRLDTVGLTHDMHTLQLEFINETGMAIAFNPPLQLLINNQRCTAMVGVPHIGGVPAEPMCGLLRYQRPPTTSVTTPFSVAHPKGFATYTVQLRKGVTPLPLPSGIGGSVMPPTPTELTATIVDLLGECGRGAGVAGFSVSVYVTATMINGEARQSQYDASDAVAFTLAPI
jgi:hypothetical protein